MNIREIALSMLNEYESLGKYVNLSLNSHITDRLKREERAALTALLYTATEHKLTYDYLICALAGRSLSDIDGYTLNILRLGMCQLLDMKSIPEYAAVNETVKLARDKGERSFVNGILRETARRMAEGTLPMPDREKNSARYISIAYSFPLWLTRHFIAMYGEDVTERIFEYFNGEGHTDLTVNTLKVTPDELVSALSQGDVTAHKSEISPTSVRIDGSVPPSALPGFEEGLFFVQDTASAIVARVLDPKPDSRVIDVCSCPGGKSFGAAIMAKDGEVVSLDIHESKLPLVEKGAIRLGIENISTAVWDATLTNPEYVAAFDRVITDVPCSGLGVLGKKPDMRYRDKDAIAELPALQYDILEASSKYLCDGGTLVYSTCTLNPRENDEVVDRFLENHEEFSCVDFKVGNLVSSNGRITLVPSIHKTDGFFIAKLTKKRKS